MNRSSQNLKNRVRSLITLNLLSPKYHHILSDKKVQLIHNHPNIIQKTQPPDQNDAFSKFHHKLFIRFPPSSIYGSFVSIKDISAKCCLILKRAIFSHGVSATRTKQLRNSTSHPFNSRKKHSESCADKILWIINLLNAFYMNINVFIKRYCFSIYI